MPVFEGTRFFWKSDTFALHKVIMEMEGAPVGGEVGRTEKVGERVGLWVIVGTGAEVGKTEGIAEGDLEG
jgi:hypothetical protein